MTATDTSAIPEGWKYIIKKPRENTTNLIIREHHVIKGSGVLTLDKVALIKICSILISKVQKNLLTFISKIYLMTMILTGQEFICYHT